MTTKTFDIDYEGWGPCAHDSSHYHEIEQWLKTIVPTSFLARNRAPIVGGLLEDLIWHINALGGAPTLMNDMWTATMCEGQIAGKSVRTYIKGNTYLISVAETFRWWRAKYEELTGEKYDD